MAEPTNTPFGWSPFAVMPHEEARGAADLLKQQGIPVIVRPGDDETSELLVPTASADRARDLLEDQGADQDDWETDPEADEAAATEGSLEDMGDVFDAADRLKHQPWNEGAAADLAGALESMTGTAAPYGIGAAFWDRVRTAAADLDEMVRTGQPEDAVRSAAGALRDLLRPYI